MADFRVVPIEAEVIHLVRTELKDASGFPAERRDGGGYGPCRACLSQFGVDEARILFSYSPIRGQSPFRESGPVYIHERECQAFDKSGELPPAITSGPARIPLLLRCYDADQRLIGSEAVGEEGAEQLIRTFFDDPRADFLHVLNAEAGCYIARIESASKLQYSEVKRGAKWPGN